MEIIKDANNTEVTEATVGVVMGYEIYMLAVEHLARMIEYPAYDDWGNVKYEIDRANKIRKYMEKKFPSLLDSHTKSKCDEMLVRAQDAYNQRHIRETEMLRRRFEFGKVTLEDVE